MESFIAGFAYGGTTVLIGQPLDTIKTIQQATTKRRPVIDVTRELWSSGGLRAFYRGGFSMLLGGGLMRSAQFGVYRNSLEGIRQFQGKQLSSSEQLFGVIDYQVVLAGFCGGIGRGFVEGPFEFVKVRRQIQKQWRLRDGLSGFGTTLLRNSILFSSFVVYMDLAKKLIPFDIGPFLTGGIGANLAWLTIWPLDVVKSRVQSGKHTNKSVLELLRSAAKAGELYKGLGPGLVRSFVANGSSMVVYKYVENLLVELNRNE